MTTGRFLVGLGLVVTACGPAPEPMPPSEDAYRSNNRGVALLEQFDYAGAAGAFRDALTVDSSLGMARFNLALAHYYAQEFDDAGREAAEAAALLPEALPPRYLLGLIARAENRSDDATDAFAAVLAADPRDVGTNINLGQLALESQDYGGALARLRIAYDEEPFNVTAAYNLGLAMVRDGDVEAGQRQLETAQTLRATSYGVTYGPGYLNEGRYAAALASTGAEAELVDPTPSPAAFSPSTIDGLPPRPDGQTSPFGERLTSDDLTGAGANALAARLGGGIALIDFDADGDHDLFIAAPEGEQLARNDGATWTIVTDDVGLGDPPPNSTPIGAVVADIDNDTTPDLFVLRYGTSSLYRNIDGRFEEITESAGLPSFPYLPGAAAFVDVDHDGDADLVLAGLANLDATRDAIGDGDALFPDEFVPAPLLLLRNNLDGTFTDITEAAGIDTVGHTVGIVPSDFNNGRDVDLLIVDQDAAPSLLINQRDFTFRDETSDVGLDGVATGATSAAVADLNYDEFPDLVFSSLDDTGAMTALSDGRGGFTLSPAPDAARGARAVRLVDYDNDGLPDLLGWGADGLRVSRNVGTTFTDVTETAASAVANLPPVVTGHALAVADIDRDGDSDILSGGPGPVAVATNSGDPRHQAIRVDIRGLVSNRLGIGAKVQLRAGSLSARLDTAAATPGIAPADLVFGLGTRETADVVRVLWPSGILQAEVAGADGQLGPSLTVQELDREPSSCPLLFTWNGEQFEFVTDFLGGGEMGYWQGPQTYNQPDPVEYVRIRGDQLKPRDGRLELRVTNELEETVFFDRLALVVLTHPADVEVYPNEGMTPVPKPPLLHGVTAVRTPRVAVDDDGTDVTDRIRTRDRRYPEGFALAPFRGYATPHHLMLDLGPTPEAPVLLLTGWTDYAFSSDNVAAAQAGLAPVLPTVEIQGTDGRWRHGLDIGIPVGRPQTIALDLGDHLRDGEHMVRIVTSMRIYWDQIQVGRRVPAEGRDAIHAHTLLPQRAELRSRGFSAEVHPDGMEPTLYDYARVTAVSPWKTLAGAYTRPGDVRPLLTAADDMFVIARDGDEVILSFDATPLEALANGWTRTYLLHADGYSKEMDINSASPHTVAPLPFHAMSGYPYGRNERYPETSAHREYRDRYNTRIVNRAVPHLDAGK